MKKQIMMALAAASLAIASVPALAMAAAAADFSGAWVRDNAKSTPAPMPMYWLTRGVSPGGGGGNAYVLQIRQEAGMVQITDPARALRTLALDGRPHTGPTASGIQQETVTAALQGGALTVTTTGPFGGMPGNVMTTAKETWSLSPDGKVLTVDLQRASPATTQTFREVFNRR